MPCKQRNQSADQHDNADPVNRSARGWPRIGVHEAVLQMVWSITGFVLSLVLMTFALRRSRAPGGFYDRDVYGMTPATHRRVAYAAACFALAFAATLSVRGLPAGAWLFGTFVLGAVLYLTSFLRGFTEDDD
jgi:hypothetical protein